jgi:outer membrane protein assembly factor BamB
MLPMMRFCSVSVLAVALSTLVQGADWPRFRGPNGAGTVEGTLPDIDPSAPLWKVRIPGKGVSSPILVNGKIYLQSASNNGKTRMLLCLAAADGKTEWTKELPGNTAKPHAKNSLASGTPACDGERIYCSWWDGSGVSAAAYDLTGTELWQRSLGGYVSQHGPGFSPMVHDGLVFLNVDDDERAELVALDAKTGEKKWSAPRKHYRASYATPFLWERQGKPVELILGTTTALTSYEPKTGKVNWEYTIAWPDGQMPLRVVGSPIYAGGLFIVSCGDGSGTRYMIAINPEGKKPTRAWDLKRDTPYVPGVLVKGPFLFWIGDKGVATCADLKTGKAAWAERVFNVDVTASPILVGDKILMISEKGEIAILKADNKKPEEPALISLGERVLATPAVADGRVFIRGDAHLFCFGKK